MARAQLVVVVGLVAVMLLVAPRTANATLCVDVIDAFASCLPYIGDTPALPGVRTAVGRREVSRRLTGAGGHRQRALGGAAILGWGLSASTGSAMRREWCVAGSMVP
jgi:hypothetical protein